MEQNKIRATFFYNPHDDTSSEIERELEKLPIDFRAIPHADTPTLWIKGLEGYIYYGPTAIKLYLSYLRKRQQ